MTPPRQEEFASLKEFLMAHRTPVKMKQIPRTAKPKLVLKFKPLRMAQWKDLEKLFGERGACGGCWCMWARLKRADFARQKGARNKAAFKEVVAGGPAPGVLVYKGAEAIGWCAVAPREVYLRLEKSRVLARVDEKPVWSITCLFVAKPFRRSGVSVGLLKAAAEYAAKHGAKLVEGYPIEPGSEAMPDAFAWTGLASAFGTAGFKEVARRSKTRPIMRRVMK